MRRPFCIVQNAEFAAQYPGAIMECDGVCTAMIDTPTTAVEDLMSAIETALREYAPVRESLLGLRINVSPDGRVAVSGPVRSGLIKDGVLEKLSRVPGVTRIVDEIVSDTELEIAVAVALFGDPRLKELPPGAIAVHSHLGQVTLVGQLEEDSIRRIAVEVAGQVGGVQGIHDRTGAR